jgi:hypothetical protein
LFSSGFPQLNGIRLNPHLQDNSPHPFLAMARRREKSRWGTPH